MKTFLNLIGTTTLVLERQTPAVELSKTNNYATRVCLSNLVLAFACYLRRNPFSNSLNILPSKLIKTPTLGQE